MQRLLHLIALLLFSIIELSALPLGSPLSSVDGKAAYTFIRILTDAEQLDEISDEDFEANSATVVFPVNVYDFPEDSNLGQVLEQDIIPQLNSDTLTLAKMFVRGAASPEGPYDKNKMLAERRIHSLFDFLNTRLKFKALSEPQFEIVPEDYDYLCLLMRKANDPDYDTVKRLVDRYLPDNKVSRLKKSLMNLADGRTWRRLKDTYFPRLRAARVIFVFRKVAKEELDYRYVLIAPDGLRPEAHIVPSLPAVPQVQPAVAWIPVATSVVRTAQQPRREWMAIKTNLLLDLAYMPGYDRFCPIPNVAVEFYPKHGHLTYGASFDCPWWQDYDGHKYFQLRQYQIETRYYLRSGDIDRNPPGQGAAYRGLYAQAYLNAVRYGIMFDADRGWVGEGLGGGLGVGYVLPISRNGHWRLDFGLQVGYLYSRYDPFQYECPVDPDENDNLYYYKWTLDASLFRERQYRLNWLGPTRVGITLSYDLLYRRGDRRGVSLRSRSELKQTRSHE